jgi:dihydroorotase
VSTREAIETIHRVKQEILTSGAGEPGFVLTCETTPHHLCLTEEDAKRLGEKTWGRVNPPLRSEEDRQALMHALTYGAVEAIATDHAPHTAAGKEAGAPGFSGFETAFAAVYTELVRGGAGIDLKLLSFYMSANPANLLGLNDGSQARGCLLPGCRADLVIIDPSAVWTVDPALLKTRGKNSPFKDRKLYGKILMTLHGGRLVFTA